MLNGRLFSSTSPWRKCLLADIIIELIFFVLGVIVAVGLAEYIDYRQERAAKRKQSRKP